MPFHALSFRCAAVVLALCIPAGLCADEIAVRYSEGISRGFLVVTSDDGRKIADGDSQQVLHGDRITSHLTFHFKDGSVYDDQTVFSEQKVFHLLSDRVVEKGPSFKTPMETNIDRTNGQVTVRYAEDKGGQKTVTKHMDLPADLANGLIFTLVKDIRSHAASTTLSYLAFTPQPRLVKVVFKPGTEGLFTVGSTRLKAEHYIMSVDIGGVAGFIAPLIGKKPPDTDIWVIGGEAPTYAGSRGPLYGGGPIWRVNLVSPVSKVNESDRD
jgi:hypothetical protein